MTSKWKIEADGITIARGATFEMAMASFVESIKNIASRGSRCQSPEWYHQALRGDVSIMKGTEHEKKVERKTWTEWEEVDLI